MSVHVRTPLQRTPSYRLHKPSGRAVVTLNGRDYYLGPYGSPESRAEYHRAVSAWEARGRKPLPTTPAEAHPPAGADLTINEVLVAYLDFADGYYVKNGSPTVEPGNIRLALRPLRERYGHLSASEFGPKGLKAVREAMIDSGLCRLEINRRVGRIVRAFKWAVSEEMVPPSVHQALQSVPGLRRGRSEARESEPVRPVPEAFVLEIEPHVPRQVWAMVQLQLHTGMRPGEVCAMRGGDLDTSGKLWTYSPATHKMEHHDRPRVVYLGPKSQEILRPWLRADLGAYLFSPAEAEAERKAEMRSRRKTKVQPSQVNRAKRRPSKTPGAAYTVASYRQAIQTGIAKANRERAARGEAEIPSWHPHQLRHNAATRLRKEIGLDAARAVLGHASTVVTEIYAERDAAVAMDAMRRLG